MEILLERMIVVLTSHDTRIKCTHVRANEDKQYYSLPLICEKYYYNFSEVEGRIICQMCPPYSIRNYKFFLWV
jgi:hypothetical protein